MKEHEFLDGVSQIEADVVESFVAMDARLQRKAGRSRSQIAWMRVGAVAACFAVVVGMIMVVPMFREDDPGIVIGTDSASTEGDDRPNIPIVNIQAPSPAPQYYGSAASEGGASMGAELVTSGLSVTAKLVETLPDTYTFFDDWHQYEFRLLRMKTVKLLQGSEMTEEFYYLVPVDFMTDFSVYDRFVIKDMAQCTYECAVMYNKTQEKAEQLDLVLFGYGVYEHVQMGEKIMAFDGDGHFDERLWKANEKWIANTKHGQGEATIDEAEVKLQNDQWHSDLYVHLLQDISGEAAKTLSYIRSLENGIYVPTFSTDKLSLSPEVQFHAVRYINGFATNEKVSVWCKEWTGGDQDIYEFTKARFDESDLYALPDLASAVASVASAYGKGDIVPPHIENHKELKLQSYGIFGWYAQTVDGVIGIVRVTWRFSPGNLDDAYYIIEQGSDECRPIDRDALVRKIGEYETTYIYEGAYNKDGKVRDGEEYA